MAFEPYLLTRKRGCYRAPLTYKKEELTPQCRPDEFTTYFRQRWDILREKGPCPRQNDSAALCFSDREQTAICLPNHFDKKNTLYNRDYQYPWSYNNIDDCCKAPCPCDKDCTREPKIERACKPTLPTDPTDYLTTHRQFFTPKPVPPRPWRKIEPWDPCGCPLESATSNRIDYPHKKAIPNGPVMARVTKHGLWSMDQFSDEPFPEATEMNQQFTKKFGMKPQKLRPRNNLDCGVGPMEQSSETCYQYPRKQIGFPQIPGWLHGDVWVKPDTPLESCTSYKHFYRKYPFPPNQLLSIKSPGAIPFPTMHGMWYTCCDPKVDQRTPVDMKDNHPWPYVPVSPVRYQDNLQTDPCAPFRDDTTNKADFTPKPMCSRPESFAPCKGFTPPIQPMNDDTTNRVSFRAHTLQEYKDAKISSGNTKGKKWGPFKCPPNVDKCLPRFPAPYGHPIKPYTRECPCGPFDDRSTYHSDFKFRSPEMVEHLNEEMCRQPNVPKGVTLYRHDYVAQHGQKAARMPPPIGKGYRCVHPSSIRDTDTLYRMELIDFWKMGDRKKLELYRGKRSDSRARAKEKELALAAAEMAEPYEIIAMPQGTTVQDAIQYCS